MSTGEFQVLDQTLRPDLTALVADVAAGTELNRSSQGVARLIECGGRRFVVKSPFGIGPARWLRRAMIRREARVYGRLLGVPGVPGCYGLVDGDHLVLDYVDGIHTRYFLPIDRDLFFRRLATTIRQLHAAGVAHGDLKNRRNVLVVGDAEPFILDLGTAMLRPVRRWPGRGALYDLARVLDWNAWVKHRHGGYGAIEPRYRRLIRRTVPERIWGRIWLMYRAVAGKETRTPAERRQRHTEARRALRQQKRKSP